MCFSGKELIDLSEKVHTKLLTTGLKGVQPEDSSDLSFLRIKENYKDVCCKERVTRLESRMVGHFNPERRTVTVKRLMGTSHRLFGQTDKEGTHLRPYEALYLMEIDDLLVYYDDVIVSIEQAYALFLGSDIHEMTLEQYIAYKSLYQSGFVVMKHEIDHPLEFPTATGETSTKSEEDTPSKQDQIWDYLRSKTHFLNWRKIKCKDIDDNISRKFRQTCARVQSDEASPNDEPQLKRQRLEGSVLPAKITETTDFLSINEKYGYEKIFEQLDVIEAIETPEEPLSETESFDFDIYYAAHANKMKLSQNNVCPPNFYGKVIRYESPVDYSLIHKFKSLSKSTAVMLLIVFDNLSVSSFTC